jgi:predicted NBD/HSP70 family sugar kinase
LRGALRGRARSPPGLPITLENDINLAALGERWLGVARGVDDFVFLSVGTGMGAGIVLRGELHTGRHGFAGEIDFALDPLDEDVDPAAPQIAELAAEIAEQHDGTSLRAPFDARSVFDAARQGDEAAQLVVDEVARRIALHLAPVAAVVDVELVVLGGGIGSNGDLLLAPVRQLLARGCRFRRRSSVDRRRAAVSLGRSQGLALRWRSRARRGGLSATVPAWLRRESVRT